jgi:hypothetical protein
MWEMCTPAPTPSKFFESLAMLKKIKKDEEDTFNVFTTENHVQCALVENIAKKNCSCFAKYIVIYILIMYQL